MSREDRMLRCIELAWGIIANSSGGNWDHKDNLKEWKPAAEAWRDEYWDLITEPLHARVAAGASREVAK